MPELKPLNALQIEDSPNDAFLVTRELRRAGYDVDVQRVEDEQQLREALAQRSWDVVLADYYLPQLSIEDALKVVRQTDRDLPFIIVSGSVGEEPAVSAMRLGAHDYIMKDNLARLAPAIEREMLEADNRRQRRRAEQEIVQLNRDLQDRVHELQALLDVIPIGISIAEDPECRYVKVNHAFAVMLQIDPNSNASATALPTERPAYRSFRIDGQEVAAEDLPLQVAARSGKPVKIKEVELVRADGSMIQLFGSAAPLFDQSGAVRGAVGAFADITERKATETALRNTEKLATVGRLAATIAHEINNPLEAVTNVLYLMHRNPKLEEGLRQYVEIAQSELNRIGSIVKHTLGFNREASRPIPVKLKDLVEETFTLYTRRLATAGITVEKRFDSEGLVEAFPGEMRQVLSNLIVNSLEALNNGGHIKIHVFDSAERRNSGRPGVRVVIADSGPGIPAEVRQRIFEPFFTTKGEKGSGLGLWVSEGIVRKHGGFIHLRSSTNPKHPGTVFSIFMPAIAVQQQGISA